MSKNGFEGSLEEFEKAISLHNSSENKMAVHHANLALESCIKTILGIEKEKPGKLIRKLIDSGTVPIYYKDFLQNFEQVLRVVTVTRNEEKGAGHGQGVSINEIPNNLTKLTIDFCASLISFLIRCHVESNSEIENEKEANDVTASTFVEDDLPF